VKNDTATVKALLEAHPDLCNARDIANKTPRHHAAIHGSKAIAELLLAKGAKPNARQMHGQSRCI
jgi:ankyrin repeat protein